MPDQAALARGKKVCERFYMKDEKGNKVLDVTGTSGISVGCVFAKEKMEFEIMYNQADELLYWVKENQKGGWKIKVCET